MSVSERIAQLNNLIETSSFGLGYLESVRRAALFPKILSLLVNLKYSNSPILETETKEKQADTFIRDFLKDSYTLNLDLPELIIKVYEETYSHIFIERNRDIFDETVDYLITGNSQKEDLLDNYYLEKAKEIARITASNYLKENLLV